MKVSIAVLILHLCAGWCVHFHTPITVHPAKEAPIPNKYEVGWAPGSVCMIQWREKWLAPARN